MPIQVCRKWEKEGETRIRRGRKKKELEKIRKKRGVWKDTSVFPKLAQSLGTSCSKEEEIPLCHAQGTVLYML